MQKFYKFKHNNLEVNKKSSSGGAFTLLSNKIFEKGGIVYGCVLDDEFNAIHIRAENKEIRNKMRHIDSAEQGFVIIRKSRFTF